MAIQIKRTTEATREASTLRLESGQPLYAMDSKQLYIGDGETEAKSLKGTGIGIQLSGSEQDAITGAVKTCNLVTGDNAVNQNKGYTSLALGTYNKVYASHSTALGYNNLVSSRWAFAFGSQNIVGAPAKNSSVNTNYTPGQASAAISAYSTYMNNLDVTYDDNFSMNGILAEKDAGYPTFNPRLATGSAAFGTSNIIYAHDTFISGTRNLVHDTIAGAGNNYIFGYQNKATGSSSGAFGSNNTVAGNNAIVMGEGLTCTKNDKLVIGRHNQEAGYIATSDYTDGDTTVFEVGFGKDDSKKNVFEVYRSGIVRAYHKPENENDVVRLKELNSLYYNEGGSTTKTITKLSQQNGKVSATYAPIAFPVTKVAGKTGDVTLSKSDVGLSNVDNTSDTTKKANFTGIIHEDSDGFVTGSEVYSVTSTLEAQVWNAETRLNDLESDYASADSRISEIAQNYATQKVFDETSEYTVLYGVLSGTTLILKVPE